jgi:predicted Zn-dependent peptidase
MMDRRLSSVLFATLAASFCSWRGLASGDPKWSLPRTTEVFMSNELKALLVTKEDAPLVTVILRIRQGSLSDPEGQEGLTELGARLLARGTSSKDASAIALAAERMGASIEANSNHEHVEISIDLLWNDLRAGLELLSELVRDSEFPEVELESVRTQMKAELRAVQEEPDAVAIRRFRSVLYGGTGYGRPVLGSEASLDALTRDRVAAHTRSLLDPSRAFLVVAGPLREHETPFEYSKSALGLVNASFQGWRSSSPAPELRHSPPRPGPMVVLVDRPDLTQIDVVVGYAGLSRLDPERIPLRMASLILGGTSSSRLFHALRSEQGLSYDLSSSCSYRTHGGEVQIRGATRPGTAARLVEGILAEVDRLTTEAPSREEVDRARSIYETELLALTETGDDLADLVADIEELGLPAALLEEAHATLLATGKEKIVEIARKVLTPEHRVIVLVGPTAELDKEFEKWGKIVKE